MANSPLQISTKYGPHDLSHYSVIQYLYYLEMVKLKVAKFSPSFLLNLLDFHPKIFYILIYGFTVTMFNIAHRILLNTLVGGILYQNFHQTWVEHSQQINTLKKVDSCKQIGLLYEV
jgi:hypothetical protein